MKNIFSRKREDPDGLVQKQREAMIDLLLLCMYADNDLAFNEERFLVRAVERFKWRSEISVEVYIQNATSKVLGLANSKESRSSFLQDINERLGKKEAKYRALNLCKVACYADWQLAEEEELFMKEIREAFKIK